MYGLGQNNAWGCPPGTAYHVFEDGSGMCAPTQAPCPQGQKEVFNPPTLTYVCVPDEPMVTGPSVVLGIAALGVAGYLLWRMR